MSGEHDEQRLSRITTLWSLVEQAHAGTDDVAAATRRGLLQRYCGAAYHYLVGALRDEDAALDLFQEFALRFVRGDFHRADRERGRFRDYLKTALIHLVSDHHRQRRGRPGPLPSHHLQPATSPPTEAEADFVECWRSELVTRAWAVLAKDHHTLHAVLLYHVQHPDVSSAQMAAELAGPLNKRLTAGTVRVLLHRAREKFADLLLAEVAQSLPSPTAEGLAKELRSLRLVALCQTALERHVQRQTHL